jgi:hypothetical protein
MQRFALDSNNPGLVLSRAANTEGEVRRLRKRFCYRSRRQNVRGSRNRSGIRAPLDTVTEASQIAFKRLNFRRPLANTNTELTSAHSGD